MDLGEGELDRRIHVKPAADLLRVDMVQVLTNPTPTGQTRSDDLPRNRLRLVLIGLVGGWSSSASSPS